MGWDLFFKKPSRHWARESPAKPRQAQQPKQPKRPTSLRELRDLKKSKPPKLTAPLGDRTKSSFVKPTLPFNIPLPFRFRGEIVGGAFIGDEERELALHGGAAERCALHRRTGLMGESFRDADLEDDDEDHQARPRGKAGRAARATSEALTKTATSASQVLTTTAAISQLSRMARRGR